MLQAGSIVDKLGLKQGKRPLNIELFGGSPDDNNAFFFYDGAMSVLNPSSTAASSSRAASRWACIRSARCAGTALSRRPAWTTCCRVLRQRASAAVLSLYDGLSIGIFSSLG